MHVAVTGASSGIGEAIVREYVRRGASVSMVARRSDLLEKIAASTGGKTHCAVADLSDIPRVADWIGPAEAALGPIDVLVNNAGMELVGPLLTTEWEQGEKVLLLNVHAALRLTRTVLPGMVARGSGCIVDIASVAGLAPMPGSFFYNASKGALAGASEGLRAELRGTGVHVLTVYPGPVHTEMGHRANDRYEETFGKSLIPWGSADVLARRVADAVERRKARVIYPRFYMLARWCPPLARWLTDQGAALKRA